MSSGLIWLAASLIVPQALAAEPSAFDWPQWRGPQRDGVSTEKNLLDSWPKDGPKLIWKAVKLGGGYSTPSVSRGKIFGMSYRGDDEVIWCLDERDGKELWVARIGELGKVAYNEGPRSTPTIDGERLYALGISGELVCLWVKDGSLVWRRSLIADFNGKMMSNWGYSESPLVDGDRVVATPGSDDAALVALDKASGKTIWKAAVPEAGGAGYSSIVPIAVDRVKMYVTWLGLKKDLNGKKVCGKGLVGIDAATGRELWHYCKIANVTANIPTVLTRENLVFCSTGYPDGGTAVLRLTSSKGEMSVEEVAHHTSKTLQNHHGGMVRIGDCVYMGRGQKTGLPTCVEFDSAKILWQENRSPGVGSASVIGADGKLYFRYEDGIIVLMEANPKAYQPISQFKLPECSGKPGWAHPVIANGRLLIRDQDLLFCYDLRAK